MKYIIGLFIILISSAAYSQDTQWSIHHLYISNSGDQIEGFIIKSDGKHGLAPGIKKEDVKLCTSTHISKSSLIKIRQAIENIPKDKAKKPAPSSSNVCPDVGESFLTVEYNNDKRHFYYKKSVKCFTENYTEHWLIDLLDLLFKEYNMFKTCEVDA